MPEDQFAVILVGNDWRNKGVLALLEALEQLRELPIKLFVVSRRRSIRLLGICERKTTGESSSFFGAAQGY